MSESSPMTGKKTDSGKAATPVATHEDPLLRFGVDLLRYLSRFVRRQMKVLMLVPEKANDVNRGLGDVKLMLKRF